MSAIGDLASLLSVHGLSADVLKLALDLAQLHVKESAEILRTSGGHPVDAAAEKRRAYDRERQRIKRELHKASIDSKNLSSSDSSIEKKEEVVITRESNDHARKARTVPESMTLSVKNLDYALQQSGWTRERAFREWDRYKNNSISKGRLYKNFDAGWRNWVTSPYQAPVNGNRNGQPTLNDVADDLIARAKELERQAGFGESATSAI